MNVAAIVITYNDDFKFNEWVENHKTYKDELYLHIIVDNGSSPEYLMNVEKYFNDSHIIKRSTNGGCTYAYNDGIKFALNDSKVDAIMLIGNDMKLDKGGVNKLSKFLISNDRFGMVAPIVLEKDSENVESFGCTISKYLTLVEPESKKNINLLILNSKEVEAVGGGMNMASRTFYEKVGLQDKMLFMYSDEVDMGIRSRKVGLKMAVTKQVKAWHQHINPKGVEFRNNYAPFLGSRNKVYLAKKHFGIFKAIKQFIYFVLLFIGLSLREKFAISKVKYFFWSVIGASYGLFNQMEIPKFLGIKNTPYQKK